MEIVELAVLVLEFLAELLLQTLFEGAAEVGAQTLRRRRPDRPPLHPLLATLGHLGLGAAAGGLTLLIFPDSFIQGFGLRIANLVLTPLCLGVIMGVLGAWRRRRDQSLVRLDHFGYAYAFAVALALVRFIWA
jgi:hypothetical protein